jgi:hypothetical protein
MAEFLTTKDVASRVEQLVRKAKKRIILISPFIRCWDTLYYRLLEAGKKGVEVVVIYGKKISKPERERLQVIPYMKLYSLEELHAKCYFNESEMVLTSLNLYDYSEHNNYEMGVVVGKEEPAYMEAFQEAQTIRNFAELKYENHGEEIPPIKKLKRIHPTILRKEGYCIRCGKPIPLFAKRPFCFDCYSRWFVVNNLDLEENYCHSCGKKKNGISMRVPYCMNCNEGLINKLN